MDGWVFFFPFNYIHYVRKCKQNKILSKSACERLCRAIVHKQFSYQALEYEHGKITISSMKNIESIMNACKNTSGGSTLKIMPG